MDLATLIGLLLSVVIVAVVMIMDGGSPAELFAHPQVILLTVGGAITASMVSYSLKVVLAVPKLIMVAFLGGKTDPVTAIELLAKMADKARRDGLLALEDETKDIKDAFLQRGVMLVVDGVDPEQVKAILKLEIDHMQERHAKGIGFFNSTGGFAPTLGIIGTVMGLVHVLKQLEDPSSLGGAIAAAFLATLWGIMSANLIWLPLAGKLKTKSEEEAAYRHLLLEGILALQAGENPRLVREKLLAFLPPKARPGEETAKAAKKAEAQA
jgi:chemotaxis protein MotA